MTHSWHEGDARDRSRYRVELLAEATPTDAGIAHTRDGERQLLEWTRIARAIAAEVGEPEGVRTIVFDLAVDTDAETRVVYRLDADPDEDAMAMARALGAALDAERVAASIKSVAADGIPTRSYPDLEAFEQDAVRFLF